MSGDSSIQRVLVEGVTKVFDHDPVLDDVNLSVARGEFVTLLGASGCGKTTLLRIIAGFEHPDTGRVCISGRDVTEVQPHNRPVNLVFQRAALFPHLNVRENIEFGLRLKRVRRAEIDARVAEALALVRMEGFGDRRSNTLSGGQEQRIALARALVNQPEVLLLDEPLSALDRQIRRELQRELKRIHRELGGTFIFVTHDQEEAMVLSDRIVLVQDGRIRQEGNPVDIYRRPQSVDAARFVGSANVLPTEVETVAGEVVNLRGDGFAAAVAAADGLVAGARASLIVRSETISLTPVTSDGVALDVNTVYGIVVVREFVGHFVNYEVARGSLRLTVSAPSNMELLEEGQEVMATWPFESALAFPA